jgi:hypothetical protein
VYEYKFFRPYSPHRGSSGFEEDELNELARDGWRVTQVLPSEVSTVVLLLEREVERSVGDSPRERRRQRAADPRRL